MGTKMINAIVFSKDRACQLDAFLRTWGMFCNTPIKALCHASANEYRAGYDRLVGCTMQTDFRADVLRMIDPDEPYTVFFVDDMLIRKRIDWHDPIFFSALESNEDVLCASLRLAPTFRYSYNLARKIETPQFDDYTEWLEWSWRGHRGEWGYPMSTDGHIFRTSDLLPILQEADFRSPNTMELAMSQKPIDRPLMACFRDGPYTMNIPANLVQRDFRNRTCRGKGTHELNEAFLAGKRIRIGPLLAIEPIACHTAAQYEMESSCVF